METVELNTQQWAPPISTGRLLGCECLGRDAMGSCDGIPVPPDVCVDNQEWIVLRPP